MSDFLSGVQNYKNLGLFTNPYVHNNGSVNTPEARVALGQNPAIKEAGHQGRSVGIPEVEDMEAASAAAELFANAGAASSANPNAGAFDADAVFAQAKDGEVHPRGIGGWAA